MKTSPRTIEIVKIADYWRVMVNRKLHTTHRTKAQATKAARTLTKSA